MSVRSFRDATLMSATKLLGLGQQDKFHQAFVGNGRRPPRALMMMTRPCLATASEKPADPDGDGCLPTKHDGRHDQKLNLPGHVPHAAQTVRAHNICTTAQCRRLPTFAGRVGASRHMLGRPIQRRCPCASRTTGRTHVILRNMRRRMWQALAEA